MPDDNQEPPKRPPLPPMTPRAGAPPPLPGLPSGLGGPKPPLPSFLGGAGAAKPPLFGAGGLPPLPGAAGGHPPVPPLPGFPGTPGLAFAPVMPLPAAAAAPAASEPPKKDVEKELMEKKLSELEKRLQEEREKILIANVKAQEEAANAARVESSIKDLQEKLRRDRRDQEQEESRLKLETKLQEMEARLAQERETWVVTLRNQMQSRETQDKEIEAHFSLRLQETERKWLEEKAQWQKLALAKDEEIRNLRTLAEKLKGADVELSKVASERKWLQDKVNELTAERAEAMARAQLAVEKEKENIQLRADVALSRQAAAGVQERLEREVQALRISAKEREERLMADVERLQRDIASLPEKLKVEHEADERRLKLEHEAELRQYREAADRHMGDLQKLRGVAGAMERQLAAARAQNAELAKTQERYKAEFVVLQRKWVEREKEIRNEAQSQALQMIEAEKVKLKILAQDEVNQRAAKIAEQLAKERDAEVKKAQAVWLAERQSQESERVRRLQGDWDNARKELEAEIDRLHKEIFKRDAEWSQRVMAKDAEMHAQASKLDEASTGYSREAQTRQALERRALELEKAVQESRESAGSLQQRAGGAEEALRRLEDEKRELAGRGEELERLCSAQAAQVQNLQEAMENLRGQLARETHLGRMYLREKEELERKLKGGA